MPPTAPGELIDAGTPATPTEAAELIDAGTPATPGAAAALLASYPAWMRITGTLNPNATGYLPFQGVDAATGRPVYSTTAGSIPATGRWTRIIYPPDGGIAWEIQHYANGLAGSLALWPASPGEEITPDLATGWAPDGSETGTPVVTPHEAVSAAELIDGGTPSTPAAPGELI